MRAQDRADALAAGGERRLVVGAARAVRRADLDEPRARGLRGSRGSGSRRRSRSSWPRETIVSRPAASAAHASSTAAAQLLTAIAASAPVSSRSSSSTWSWREPRSPLLEVELEVRVAARRPRATAACASAASGARPRFVWTTTPVALSTRRRRGRRRARARATRSTVASSSPPPSSSSSRRACSSARATAVASRSTDGRSRSRSRSLMRNGEDVERSDGRRSARSAVARYPQEASARPPAGRCSPRTITPGLRAPSARHAARPALRSHRIAVRAAGVSRSDSASRTAPSDDRAGKPGSGLHVHPGPRHAADDQHVGVVGGELARGQTRR